MARGSDGDWTGRAWRPATSADEIAEAMAGKGTNVQLGTADLVFLERRGARSHRGGSVFSRASVLSRLIQGHRALLEHADPRPRLPPGVFEAAVALLPAGWTLKPLEIEQLEKVLARAGEMAEVAARAKLDPRAIVDAVAALSFAEKFALVDLAIQSHAPAAAAARPEEP
jgi:hypothetical protein